MVILIVFVGMLLILSTSEGRLFTHPANITRPPCKRGWCNLATEKFPNLYIPMTGYNVIKGNPFTGGVQVDPGFSNAYIFKIVHHTEGGDDIVEGLRAILSRKCSLQMKTEFASSVKQYRKEVINKATMGKNFGVGLDAEVEAGIKGLSIKTRVKYSVETSFRSEKTMKDVESYLTKNKGVISFNEATCSVYNVRFNKYRPPPFDEGFVDALKYLQSNIGKSKEEQKYAVSDFINEFGTHYLHEVTMGARLSIHRKYSTSEYATSSDKQITECNKSQFNYNFFIVHGGHDKEKCKAVGGSGHTEHINGYLRETITSYGSNPKDDLVKWSNQEFDAPLPIRVQLTPIINLFQRTYFHERYPHIDYKGILKFLAPAYYSYCEDNKDAFGVETCEVSQRKGCGWSDTCDRRSQTCVNDDSSAAGYDCKDKKIDKSFVEAKVKQIAQDNLDMSHEEFSELVHKFLASYYRSYYFVVNVYDPVGYDIHAAFGDNMYKSFREYGRNIVVGWSNRNSLVPDNNKLKELRILYNGPYVDDDGKGHGYLAIGSYPTSIAKAAENIYLRIMHDYNHKWGMSMVNVVYTGNGFHSVRSGKTIYYERINACKELMYGLCFKLGPEIEVVILFGEQ